MNVQTEENGISLWHYMLTYLWYICLVLEIYMLVGTVEKRKISYFGLALNLFQHLISPNQDDLSYSARTFISG